MISELLSNDRIIKSLKQLLDACAAKSGVEIVSMVLYGSKAKGDRNSQNDYDIMLLLKDGTALANFIRFNEALKIEIIKEKLLQVKFLTYTPDTFEDIMYNDSTVGTYFYIICKENLILYDKFGAFSAIKEKLQRNERKDEEEFLMQCIEFARMMGSEKWERKWEKALMQYRYFKKRRTT